MDKRKQLSKQEFTKPDRAPCAVTELLLHRPCTAQGHRRGSSPTAPGATIIHALLPLLQLHAMAAIHITDIEAAINHWRQRLPSSAGMALAPQVQALADGDDPLLLVLPSDHVVRDAEGFRAAVRAAIPAAEAGALVTFGIGIQ